MRRPRASRRLLAVGLASLIAGMAGIARAGNDAATPPADAGLAEALRRGAMEWKPQYGFGDPAIRALLETGETGRAVAEELSRSGDRQIRQLASELLARAEQEGSWNALMSLDAPLLPRAIPAADPAAESRALDELESTLPRLEAAFPGDVRPTGCGNSTIGEYSEILGVYVRLGSRACASLARLARDADGERRLRALQVVAAVECPTRQQIVDRALEDSDPRVRLQAVSMLDGTFATSCEHRDALRRLLKDDDVPCRLAAAGALARCGDVAALPVLLASARIAAETDDGGLQASHAIAFRHLPVLTSYVAPGGADDRSGAAARRTTARWWTEWGEAQAAGFDVRAAHLDALRAALDLARANPHLGHAPRPPGRDADVGVLLELDAPTAVGLLLENLDTTRRAGFALEDSLGTASHGTEEALAALERIARDEGQSAEARRDAVSILARLDAERARALVASLLRSPRPGDRQMAWGPLARKLAPDEVRRAALVDLASAAPGAAKALYWELRDVADAEDCAALLPIVVSETDLADRIAGWDLLARLQCPAAKEPMRARLSDPDLGSWLAAPIASYRDLSVISDLPCVSRPCSGRLDRSRTLMGLAIVLDRRTVPGLVYGLECADPAVRLGSAAALREAILEHSEHPTSTEKGLIDFTRTRLDEPYVRAALERAGARTGDLAAAVAREAAALLGGSGSVPAR